MNQKFGAGQLGAEIRAGGQPLDQALVAFPNGSLQHGQAMGSVWNPTPQEVMEGKKAHSRTPDQSKERGVEPEM